jgi:hypothetical protein
MKHIVLEFQPRTFRNQKKQYIHLPCNLIVIIIDRQNPFRKAVSWSAAIPTHATYVAAKRLSPSKLEMQHP